VIRLFAMMVLLATSLLPLVGLAQSNEPLPRLELETASGDTTLVAAVEPGDTIRDQVRLGSDRATRVTLRAVNLTSPPNGGIVPVLSGPLTAPATWLQLETGEVELTPGSDSTRSIQVAVPNSAAPGQYLAAVTIDSRPPVVAGGQLPQTASATLVIAITVAGTQNPAFELADPALEQPPTGPTLVIPISNTGNLTVAPAGDLTIVPASGSPITLPLAFGPIIPGVTTTLEVPLNDVPAGEAKVQLTLSDVATGARGETTATIDLPASNGEGPGVDVEDATPSSAYAPDGEPVDVTIRNAHLTAEGVPVEFVTVSADLVNIGEPVGPVSLVMDISRDGAPTESVTLVDFASVPRASLSLNTTYVPDGGFSSGLWTFRLRLVDADGLVVAQTGTFAKLDLT
jgi:hypothetical protein